MPPKPCPRPSLGRPEELLLAIVAKTGQFLRMLAITFPFPQQVAQGGNRQNLPGHLADRLCVLSAQAGLEMPQLT